MKMLGALNMLQEINKQVTKFNTGKENEYAWIQSGEWARRWVQQ